MVEWKTITDQPTYEVSDNGDVRNSITGKCLKPRGAGGYLQVTLCDEDGHHQKTIHRLVAKEFVENPRNCNQVNHIDGDKKNNVASNLEWCTGSENVQHAYATGLQKPIPSQIEYSLSRSAEVRRRPVVNIETGARYNSIVECANAENITHSAVSFHLAGKAKKRRFEYAD